MQGGQLLKIVQRLIGANLEHSAIVARAAVISRAIEIAVAALRQSIGTPVITYCVNRSPCSRNAYNVVSTPIRAHFSESTTPLPGPERLIWLSEEVVP